MSKANASGLVDDYDLVDQRNPGAATNGLKDKEKAVVLIHGWNPGEVVNPLETGEWKYLSGNLQAKLNETSKDWAIVNFNWARSAATGGTASLFLSGSKLLHNPPIKASENAQRIGYTYARKLAAGCPKLRRVHFIAHSAGTWLARSAMLELMRLNPMVVCELTLLDPYVPGRLEGMNNPLNAGLEGITDPAVSGYRVWWVQNLYSKDITTGIFTKGDLNWVGGLSSGQNFLVDGGSISYNPYGSHAGPIKYYADTIAANISNYVPPADLNTTPNPPAWRDHGAESGFWNTEVKFPKVSEHFPKDTENIFRPSGQKVQLKVTLSDPAGCSYQWYILQDRGSESGQILTPVPAPSVRNGRMIEVSVGSGRVQYVCGIENSLHLKTFSSVFSVSPDASVIVATPSISTMSPSSPSSDSSGSQLLTVTGRGFQASANTTAVLTSPSGGISTDVPTVISSAELSFSHSFTGQPGIWSLVVKKGTIASAPFTFRVGSSAPASVPRTLSRIAIDGLPGSIFEGQTAPNVKIHAFYSDGYDSQVSAVSAANWNIQPSAISFSSPSSFVAGQVDADTTATITATYSEGGVTITSPAAVIMIRNNTSSGGVTTGEIVKNGILANNGTYWTNNNADFRITSDYSFGGHTGGYAWMATSAGGQGNNLTGAISQIIDLPSIASALTLKFSCAISVQNPAAATSTDSVSVILRDENDYNPITLTTVDPVNQPTALGQWKEFVVDLTAYKGTRKKLVFGGSTDFSNPATLRVDDVRVEMTAASSTLVDLAIAGADAVKEGSSSSYKAMANLSTGAASDVTSSTTWSVNQNATISGGNLSALQVAGQRTTRITATYSSGGITKSAFKDVTILDTAPVPVSLAIFGPSEVDENSGGSFSAVMLLSTGVYMDVSGSTYWSFSGSGGQVDPIGRLFTGEVSSDARLIVKASYEKDGVLVSAEFPLTVKDRLPPVLPTSIAIVGPASVAEATAGLYDAEVTYADGSKKFVNPVWQENSRFTAISEYGSLFCEEILSNQSVTLTATFTENSATVNTTKLVTISNTHNTDAKPEIIMPASVEVPVDRPLNLRLQTAHPAVSATVTGLPSGLTFNSDTFEIQGTPVDVGTWEIQLSATNDFGTSYGLLLFTVSEDAGPEWIRFAKAESASVPAIGITSDGEGGCYLWGFNNVAHRNAAGVIDFNTGHINMTSIHKVSGSPAGFAVTGRFDATFSVGGRTITKFPNGEGEVVIIVFDKSGQALWHSTAYSTYTNVNPGPVILNPDGSLFWGLNYRAEVSFPNLSFGLRLMNPSNPNQFDCAVIKINPSRQIEWGQRWGGTGQDEISEISPISFNACRVKVSSRSTSLVRQTLYDNGLYPSSWNAGTVSGDWQLVEIVNASGGVPEFQFGSSGYGAYLSNILTDPDDSNRFWASGYYETVAGFSRIRDGSAAESRSFTGGKCGFVVKPVFNTGSSPVVEFRPLAQTFYGVNDMRVYKIAAGENGSVLSTGIYTPSLDSGGKRYLDNPQDYAQLQPTRRIFLAGHDTNNNLKWALACGGENGGEPVGIEKVAPGKWVMLANCNGSAKFGRLPVIAEGGTVLVDIETKWVQTDVGQTYEKWISSGMSAGDLLSVRAGNYASDLNQNGKPDLLDYAFGAPTVFDLPFSDPTSSWVVYPDTTNHLAITFDRALGRADSKIAVEVSDNLLTWRTGSVYAIGADIPETILTKETARVNMGSFERITVSDKKTVSGARFMRIKVTTGAVPVPN